MHFHGENIAQKVTSHYCALLALHLWFSLNICGCEKLGAVGSMRLPAISLPLPSLRLYIGVSVSCHLLHILLCSMSVYTEKATFLLAKAHSSSKPSPPPCIHTSLSSEV